MIGGNLGAAIQMLKVMNQQGGASQSWESYWANQTEVLFFGLYADISGGQMPNKKTGSSDYLTVAGSAGSETYQCPNTAPYIAADTDYIWFKTDETQRTVTTAELIGYDLQRTPVKYQDASPNEIVAIIILNAAVTEVKRDKLFRDMWLPILWDNDLNGYGHIKDNRIGQQLWTPEAVATFYDTFTDTDDVELISHTPDIGGFTWIDYLTPAEKWKISGNKATSIAYNGWTFVYFDSSKADADISVDITVPDGDYLCGIHFRRDGANTNWSVIARRETGVGPNVEIRIYKYRTLVLGQEVAHVAGTKTLRVITSGNYVTVYWGGVKVIDNYETDGSYSTATVHGMVSYCYDSFLTTSFDNFSIV